jgi:hypothetical protein
MEGAVTIDGSASVKLNHCTASTNSNHDKSFYLQGHGGLDATCATTVGGADTGSGLKLGCGEVITGSPPVLDPYKDTKWPIANGQWCSTSTSPAKVKVYSSGGPQRAVYCSLSNLSGDIEFEPGIYVVPNGGAFSAQGNSSVKGASIKGTDVTFAFEGDARFDIAGNADLALSAPTNSTHTYAGILLLGNSTSSAEGVMHKVLGTSNTVLSGAIYFPNSDIVYQGNSEINGSCVQILADQVTFTGNTELELGSSCTGAGTKPLLTGQIAKIVE